MKNDKLMERLRATNNRYVYLLEAFQIPSKSTDDIICSDYLLDGEVNKSFLKEDTEDVELHRETRLEVMKNKISSKYLHRKKKQSSDGKIVRKQILKDKHLKKSLHKIQQIEQRSRQIKREDTDSKEKVTLIQPTAMFNAESKIVFSKIQFNENDVHRKGVETDARKLLRKVLKEKKELNELRQSGNGEKFAEVKNKKAWERATAKTLGHKVRDDLGLLSKRIQKRKHQVNKSKQEWADRKQKLEYKKDTRQKQRTENIKQRADQKKNKKLLNLAKKGRIIPGF